MGAEYTPPIDVFRLESRTPTQFQPLNCSTMIQGIVFDFDGVIVDTEPLHYRAFQEVMGAFGVEFDYAEYQKRYIGFDDRDGFAAIAGDHDIGLDDVRLAELIERKADTFERLVRQGVEPIPGVIQLIQAAAERWTIAICSGAIRRDIDAALETVGNLSDLFSHIVTAEDVARSKPDPASYTLAATRLGLEPAHLLAIEDTPAGLRSASGAGLHTLAVTTTCSRQELEPLAERVVASLEEVDVDQIEQWT